MPRADGELMGAGRHGGLVLAGGHLTAVSPWGRGRCGVLGFWRTKESRSQVRCQAFAVRKLVSMLSKYHSPPRVFAAAGKEVIGNFK